MSRVPDDRIRCLVDAPVHTDGRFVLYWMTAHRRPTHNFALDHAVDVARRHGKPLLVLEALRADHPYPTARVHAFVLDGMRENAEAFARAGIRYYPYVETERGGGKGLLEALAAHAVAVVADDSPAYFQPRMLAAAATKVQVGMEAVDACGILPLAATDKAWPTAYAFRRFLQRTLPERLGERPRTRLAKEASAPASVPQSILRRWPAATRAILDRTPKALAALPLDHEVAPLDLPGGPRAARRRLTAFVQDVLPRYIDERNQPEAHATSGLSPYLHFGHVSTFEVFDAIRAEEDWTEDDLSARADGRRAGWWGMRPSAEAFLDQVITWRELGLNGARYLPEAGSFDYLPPWARESLEAHATDPRERVYSRDDLEGAATDDPIWNAAQRQLRREGVIHNYLRMLWGKRVLTWTEHPREAWRLLFDLNDRWALDGRDANSISGIAWCFGRYDRPWAPRRAVFGVVRCMTSASTRRKLRLEGYLSRFGAAR